MSDGKNVIIRQEPASPSYGGSGQTQEIRKQTVGNIVKAHRQMLSQGIKVILSDVDQVESAAEGYMAVCENTGILPSLEGFAGYCHVSRYWIYEYCIKHRGSPSADYIETLKTMWGAARIAASERGAASEATSIFVLKNSGLNMTDKVEISPSDNHGPLVDLDADQARKRIMDAIPAEDDD